MANLSDLHQLTRVHYERAQQSLKSLAQQEALIRAELQRLSEQERAANANARAIGADVIWLGWVGRSKAQLNIALAQILAQKEHHLARVRTAYGKVLVTRQLAENAARDRSHARSKAQLETAQETALWRSLEK